MSNFATPQLLYRPSDGGSDAGDAPSPPKIAPPAGDLTIDKTVARSIAAHCAQFRKPDVRRALIQLIDTVVPLVLVIVAMVVLIERAYWATLLLAIPGGGLLVRLFIIQHDAGHGSFLPWQAANTWLGRAVALVTFTPYGLWRHGHALHHATSGNLDRRGAGDIKTLTVVEYMGLTPSARLRYRVYRNPIFLFVLGVPFFFLVLQRLPWTHPLPPMEAARSVVPYNFALVGLYGSLSALIGLKTVVLVGLPMLVIASAVGGWLFFIQHQFEDTLWDHAPDWDFQIAAIAGSSYYDLPRWLQWFTGNIGLHHIHHLSATIPNYRLQECLDARPELTAVNRIGLWESFACANLTLWCEQRRKLVTFRDALVRSSEAGMAKAA